MLHTYSYTFKFESPDTKNNTTFNNILSIVEEDAKKHYVNYVQYQYVNEQTITSRQVSLHLDRYYYLEIANISIDDDERRKRLFTVIGKRRFGSNDNKIDSYFSDENIKLKDVYNCFKNNESNNLVSPIIYELITHTTNKYKAHPFICNNNYFIALKQTNISNRKTFEKTFLVQMDKMEYNKLLMYKTSALKIDFIFNAIGKIYFKSQDLSTFSFNNEHVDENLIMEKVTDFLDDTSSSEFLPNKHEVFHSLKENFSNIEKCYYNLLSKSIDFINQPDDNDTIVHFNIAISKYVESIENEEHLEEIISFFSMLKIFAQEKKISYLIAKNDQDIKDIFLFLLETITIWNASIKEKDYQIFHNATKSLYQSIKHFMDIYYQYYYDYISIDSNKKDSQNDTILDTTPIISAKEFFEDLEFDSFIIAELSELEDEMIDSLYKDTFEQDVLDLSVKFLRSYIRMLDQFYGFKEVAYALSLLSSNLSNFDISKDSTILMSFFKGIVKDLMEWKNNVLVEQCADDIHYLDKSFYANIAQIDILINENSEVENEIEFF